jgi:hypothetical protein
VVSFNHPSEIEWLKVVYPDVEFVATERTAMEKFGRHYVRVNVLLDWVVEYEETALIINSDLRLKARPEQLERLGNVAKDGLPYLLQYNYHPDGSLFVEPCGISAFFVNPKVAVLYDESFLCLGKPWWDYWIPFVAVQKSIALYCPSTILAFHPQHPSGGWTREDWLACAVELDRMTGGLPAHEESQEAASRMSAAVYGQIVQHTQAVDMGKPLDIEKA